MKHDATQYDAIIIGAGPAGSTTALLLARAGWSVAIVEKTAFPRRKVCGEFMSATNAPLFAELGLTDLMARLSGPEVERVGLYARDALLEAPMPLAASSASGMGRALGRDVLDALLLDNAVAAGATLWQPWSAIAIVQTAERSHCTIRRKDDQAVLQSRIVVAAHGSWEHSGLPTQAKRPHRPDDLLGFKAHFHNAKLPAGLMPLLVFPGGYGGMVTSDCGRVSLTGCITRKVLDRVRAKQNASSAGEAFFKHVMASCAGVEAALTDAVQDGAWLAAGPINPGIRKRYEKGIFRVGNAAGEAHPIVAEGISMAMQSGWLLAHHLIAAEARSLAVALPPIGAAYSSAWSERFAPRIRAASLFAKIALNPVLASSALTVIKLAPRLLTVGATLSGKTRLSLPDREARPMVTPFRA